MTQSANDSKNSAVNDAPSDGRPATPYAFKVVEVERSSVPDGGEGQDWQRYVLKSSSSTIVGLRRGSRKDVVAYATECAERLSARGMSAQPVWRPRGRKPASST
ncbi:MAG: hypothetical protein M0Z84_06760 [Gammaproteobacteria bacterium]|nr:hypothetical protein [Gammaproteobacteria bacterium]